MIIKNLINFSLIKDLYFSDSIEGRTPNTYAFVSSRDKRGDLTFYYVFQHSTTTNSVMSIAFTSRLRNSDIHGYIHVDKSKVVISGNPLIDDPSLRTFNIPNNSLGKQVWFWIWGEFAHINIIFSGISKPINVANFIFINGLKRVNVDDNPFTKKRGLITKNIYDNSSEAYQRVKEFEKSEGTII